MSKLDRQILETAEISQADVAKALKLSRQRVSQLVAGHDRFLTPVRVEAIYAYLKGRDDPGAETFKRQAEEKIRGAVEHLSPAFIRSYPDSVVQPNGPRRPWDDAEELWVFAPRPLELCGAHYLEDMQRRYFTLRPEIRLQKIMYFVPPGIANQLCRYLNDAFQKIPLEHRAWVSVIECAAALICPRFLIFDPRSSQPLGFIPDENGLSYSRMAQAQVIEILDGLRKSGIGGRLGDIYVPPSADDLEAKDLPQFQLRFSSRQDPIYVKG